MWLDLGIKRQYRFDDILDPVPFFEHLALLLEPDDTLVLGCYDAREDIRHFLMAESLPSAQTRYGLQGGFDMSRSSYPRGAAFYLPSTRGILEQVTHFAHLVARPEELCDHVAAYSRDRPLFIFHDAFCSDPLYVSSHIRRERIESFAHAINVPFQEIDFEYTF